MNHQTDYAPLTKSLHWGMAVIILCVLSLGVYMTNLAPSPAKLQYYSWHKSLGVTLLALAWLRLVWRLVRGTPDYPDTLPRLMQRLAHRGHQLLYVLMIAMPLSGWLTSSAKGHSTDWFGLVPLPTLIAENHELADILGEVHEFLGNLLLVLIISHTLAAIFHHVVRKDNVLRRMLP